ncbi:hypothetical protein HK102_008684, partial [Quaeritorhiza haematococci]
MEEAEAAAALLSASTNSATTAASTVTMPMNTNSPTSPANTSQPSSTFRNMGDAFFQPHAAPLPPSPLPPYNNTTTTTLPMDWLHTNPQAPPPQSSLMMMNTTSQSTASLSRTPASRGYGSAPSPSIPVGSLVINDPIPQHHQQQHHPHQHQQQQQNYHSFVPMAATNNTLSLPVGGHLMLDSSPLITTASAPTSATSSSSTSSPHGYASSSSSSDENLSLLETPDVVGELGARMHEGGLRGKKRGEEIGASPEAFEEWLFGGSMGGSALPVVRMGRNDPGVEWASPSSNPFFTSPKNFFFQDTLSELRLDTETMRQLGLTGDTLRSTTCTLDGRIIRTTVINPPVPPLHDHLLSIFFTYFYKEFPVFHSSSPSSSSSSALTFTRPTPTPKPAYPPAVLNAIFALSSLFSRHPDLYNKQLPYGGSPRKAAEWFARKAQQGLKDVADPVESVRALVVLGSLEYGEARGGKSLIWLTHAARQSQQVGLDKKAGHDYFFSIWKGPAAPRPIFDEAMR